MNVAVFSTKPYDEQFLNASNRDGMHQLTFFEPRLTATTLPLVTGFDAICVFVNDVLDAKALQQLATRGIRTIALRCAGFNNVDLTVAEQLGITVVRVPAYSPYAVAEHTVALLMTLNRCTHRAYNRVREGNFALDGLLGFDLHGRTVGLIGTGKIGQCTADIFAGFGCNLIAYDPYPDHEYAAKIGLTYVDLATLYTQSDIITIHCPLTPETHHMLDEDALIQMKQGVILINTSRGAIIDTAAVINALKQGKIGGLGLDVYEEEADLFFEDLSGSIIQDDLFARLLTFPNVLITGHQGFFTAEALTNIADTTIENLTALAQTGRCDNVVTATKIA